MVTTLDKVGVLIGALPTSSAGNLRYSPEVHALVFTAEVFSDGDLANAVSQERAWNDRKDTARAYDGGSYIRHWNHYMGPTHSSLFFITLSVQEGNWQLGNIYTNLLKDTTHVRPFSFIDTLALI